MMLRRLAPAAALLILAAAPLPAQLGLITVPHGSFRVDLSGAFYPNSDVWFNGNKRPLGSFVDGTANPTVASLQASLASLLGQSVTGLSLGGVTAIASREHGVGDIGFAFGLTPRLTIFGTVPVVYTRSRIKTTFDGTTSRVGVNPANAKLGTSTGANTANVFFSSFDVALDTLRKRIQGNYYSGANATLAQQSVTSGTAMRAALYALIADPAHASPVLPTAGDPLTTQLLAKIAGLQSTVNGALALPTPFVGAPEFPATTLTSAGFDSLLNEPAGLGLSSPNNLPHWGLGDMSAGIAYELSRHGTPGGDGWRSIWLRATGRFPNAAAPDPGVLLDQGTGAKHKALQLEGILDVGTHSIGVRAEASWLHQLPANLLTRPTSPDQLLAPPSFLAAVTTQSGDSISITAHPWLSFAPHLALSGTLQYWRRGASTTTYLTGQAPIANVDPASLDVGSAANAIVVGIGISYFHDGRARDGTQSMPVEAGWSFERTVSSGAGIFPVTLTSRLYLRLYRPLVKH